MANYNWIGSELIEKGIMEEPIFERFPKLIPKGGENYWQGKHLKLLIIGESNYFRNDMESKSDFKLAEKWYKGKNSRLIPEEMKTNVNNWKSGGKFNNIFKSIKTVLLEQGINDFEKDLLHEFKYYNYFIRPATVIGNNKFFEKDCKEVDCHISYVALCGIINEDKPNIVIFVSKYAYEKFKEYGGTEINKFESVKLIDFVYHFSSRYWNELDGKYKFENLLREHWVNKNTNYLKLQIIHNLLFKKFKNNIYKSSSCSIHEGNYLSCLYLQISDKTFCCETGVKMNDNNFWTCFYKTENSKEITGLENKKYSFSPNISNNNIVIEIEKIINQIIVEDNLNINTK